ncbi:MAG: M28 family metallopeptidase [Candidatus Acidiferrales bacterium]
MRARCAARSANSKTRTAATQEAPLPSHPFREWLAAASLAAVVGALALSTAFALAPRTSTVSVTGYSPAAGEHELTIEKETRAFASSDQISKFHRFLTAEPHPAGSERNNELARWVAEQWKQQGLEDVTIREYDVLNSTPREISLEMTGPKEYRATLREAPYDADSDTKNPRASGAFLGYSASGEVTASVVYAHSGNPEDYDLLGQQGISVRGKIVLVRYSNPYSYRGFKALTAEREGAAAILIYSDPAEDGFKKGKVFPDGPWGPETHIQRGAITYDFLEPGDPLTPGWASVPGAKRIPASEAISLPKIMGVPLSWHDARPLLENMDGPVAPDSWQGGLPFKYHVGGERVRVHLKVDMDTSIQPYYVTEARIRGAELPDEWIVLGNHRDAWVFGGVDPSSGTASMLELTRDLGQMLRRGIRPRRTLVICSWDGEEYALTGSTEWGEQFADELKQKAVAYLNVDSSASGPVFHGTPVASLAPVLVDISRTLPAPSGKTLYDEWKTSREDELHAGKPVDDSELADTRIGSGSDHTVFLNFLGIPTVGLQFDGPYGVYHSLYDDYYWTNHFGDPGYRYHTLMTQLWGALALRLANAEVLPYDFEFYGNDIRQFVDELDSRSHVSSHLDLKNLYQWVGEFESAGRALNAAEASALDAKLDASTADRANRALLQVERNWCNPSGIPGRPWFKHTLYAARYTYAHLELPGLTEAAEAGDWKRAAEQQKILEDELQKNTALLDEVRKELQAAANRGN